MANRGTNAPTNATWIVCLILYVVALLDHFKIVHLGNGLGDWAWILGFAVLLIAVRVRGL
jgi:hypothetical protein